MDAEEELKQAIAGWNLCPEDAESFFQELVALVNDSIGEVERDVEGHLDAIEDITGRSLEQLSPDLPEIVCLQARLALSDKGDRQIVLVLGSYLEEILKRLLKAFLVDKPKIIRVLFAQSGPLSSQYSRIDLAYSLGLVSVSERRDLHLIRLLRNKAAHSFESFSLEAPDIASMCSNLHDTFGDAATPVDQFTAASRALTASLSTRRHSVERRAEFPDSADPVGDTAKANKLKARIEARAANKLGRTV